MLVELTIKVFYEVPENASLDEEQEAREDCKRDVRIDLTNAGWNVYDIEVV